MRLAFVWRVVVDAMVLVVMVGVVIVVQLVEWASECNGLN